MKLNELGRNEFSHPAISYNQVGGNERTSRRSTYNYL